MPKNLKTPTDKKPIVNKILPEDLVDDLENKEEHISLEEIAGLKPSKKQKNNPADDDESYLERTPDDAF